MGVPKFFRWLSERYPKINQRCGSVPKTETCEKYFGHPPPPPTEYPDPLSTCGLPPEVDRLYIDMNGIIHGCSHNNSAEDDETGSSVNSPPKNVTREEIFRNVCYYLDRVVGDIVQPNQMVYMAIDGVAPRAKLNQQRARRYRSGLEGQIETTIYEAHAQKIAQAEEQRLAEERNLLMGGRSDFEVSPFSMDDGYSFSYNGVDGLSSSSGAPTATASSNSLEEVAPGRFKGKFEATSGIQSSGLSDEEDDTFHSNVITPGTPFFQEFTKSLEHFVKYKISTDPKWQKLTIVFSGPNVPGEGEHKIMDFIRAEKKRPDYNPNLRHCIMGQDGDLIMLGLATHEPNLVLFRERVVFNMTKVRLAAAQSENGLDSYLHNSHFEFLHMGVLRDYLAFEFETSNVIANSTFDLEHTIDDFVFMTFFVGNDFLPHMPALDIADHAFDLLFQTYKQCRAKWAEEDPDMPYLTNAGNIVSGRRLEDFLTAVGSHEVTYYERKRQSAPIEYKRIQRVYKKFGMDNTIPDADLVASKEESDRAAYRNMLMKERMQLAGVAEDEIESDEADVGSFSPVMTGAFQPRDEDIDEGLFSKLGNLLQNSLSSERDGDNSISNLQSIGLDDQDLKGRYYYDKFQFSPFDEEKHLELRTTYIEGLVWNLKYYYEGCVSWEWYFPYHYGPMLSDLVNLDEIIEQISFDGKLGAPLKPFEQLMGCMPPSQSRHLPKPYRKFMTDPESPIIDFYPESFTIDMNGKRWPWEAVTLLPFIDSTRLLAASATVDESELTEEERARNSFGEAAVFSHDPNYVACLEGLGETEGLQGLDRCTTRAVSFSSSPASYQPNAKPILEPKLAPGVTVPLAGYGSLRDADVQYLWRRNLGIDVFSSRSRYRTSCLEMLNIMPPLPPIEDLAPKLIGTSVFVNYPYFLEAFVTAVSDESTTFRGVGDPKKWSGQEAEAWRNRRDGLIRQQLIGEGLTGTGGVLIPEEQPIILSVRPFEKIVETTDGALAKSYAKFEIEVPLIATFWNPSSTDPRLDLPSKLEKNRFVIAMSNPIQKAHAPSNKNNRGAPKRLFPPKKSISSGVSMQQANFSSMALDHPTKRNFSSLPITVPGEVGAITATDFSNLPRPPLLLRGQASGRQKALPISRHYTTLRRAGSTSRGTMLAVGLAAASVVFGFAQSTPIIDNYKRPRLDLHTNRDPGSDLISRRGFWGTLKELRGGDSEPANDTSYSPPPLEFAHGTTTLSFIFQGGIVAAVDSRASLGSFVGSKTTQKVLPVNSHILGTMAGGAADCMYWIRNLKSKALLHELAEESRMTVARASRILCNALYEQRANDLSVGTMVMGYDEEGPPSIFYVDNTGKRIEGEMFAVGSGSTFALGILDMELRKDISVDEAIALGIKAIRHATFRDAYSGGFINVYLITREGWKKVYTEDIAGLAS